MNTQDKLAEALQELKSIANALPALATKVDIVVRLERAERMAATINKIIQAHAAEAAQIARNDAIETAYERENNPNCEAAQAQAQSGEWVMVPREPTKAMVDAVCKIKLDRLEALRSGREASSGIVSAVREEWEAMLATAPQQAAEPVAWSCQDTINDDDGCPIGMDEPRVHWGSGCPDDDGGWLPLYTCPQPAQDAKDAAERLCRIYFEIAAEAVGEDEVRRRRDAAIKESGR